MLSEGVLKIDVCHYLEDNWPLDDEDLDKIHKLYKLVAYQRCSRWVFQILRNKNRRPLLRVFTQEFENGLRRVTTFILILNTQKN